MVKEVGVKYCCNFKISYYTKRVIFGNEAKALRAIWLEVSSFFDNK